MALREGAPEGSLLLDGEHVLGSRDLLPTNTQIFSSTVHYSGTYYGSQVGVLVAFIAFMVASSATHGDTHIAFLAVAVATLVLGVAAGFCLRMRTRLAYLRALSAGEWHEGIIVFPTGDVVVRFHTVLYNVDQTIEAAYLSRAEVHRTCTWRCQPYNQLRLHFLGIDAKPVTLTIGETYLRDSATTVAEYINDAKSRSTTGSLF